MPRAGKPRPRVIISANTRAPDQGHHGNGEQWRCSDFEALASTFSGDVVDWNVADRSVLGRALRRKVGFGPVAAVLLFRRRGDYDVAWCGTEVEGLLLAFLFKLLRVRRILFMKGIETLSPKALLLIRWLRVWTQHQGFSGY